MAFRPSVPSSPSGTTWGSPTRQRLLRFGAGLVSMGVVAVSTAALSIGAAPSHADTVAYDPAADPFSMAKTTQLIGAEKWWNAGYTGNGVDVAVIDTGVSPVEGLAQPGKIINGPDLSFESQAPNLAHLDTNGHGTFMAGLIAGHDSDLSQPYANAPDSQYRGVAPDARIVNVKVGTADGGVDVSQVIAAIDWVVQHKDDNGMHIRVLNLSYGTNSNQDSLSDPLSYAAEQAWKAGIVVVVAAGNSGYQTGSRRARSRGSGVQQLRARRRWLRPRGHHDLERRHRGRVLRQRRRLLRVPDPRLRGARLAHARPARAERLRRREPPGRPPRRPLLPRLGHQRGRRNDVGRGGAHPAEVPVDDPRRGQELHEAQRVPSVQLVRLDHDGRRQRRALTRRGSRTAGRP